MKSKVNEIINVLHQKGIELNNVVSIEEIKEFEQKFHINLPEDIVTFYTCISDGCKMIDDFELLSFKKWKYNVKKIYKEFPFNKYYIWEDDNNENIEDNMEKVENGNIEIIDIGDSQTWNIIVSGEEYGKMWFFTDVGIQPAAPSMTFEEWFMFWLNGGEDYFSDFVY